MTTRTIEAWRSAGERGDARAAAACLAPDADLISPLTDRLRFHGRDEMETVLEAAFAVISDLRFHTELGDGDSWALFYFARVADREFEEAQLLRLDGDGLIRELTLFGRPLPALTGLMSRLGPELARRQGRPALARFLGASTAPLHAMTLLGDRRVVPLAEPKRT